MVNISIKQPITTILEVIEDKTVVGMSNTLVKSTVVMKENLNEHPGVAEKFPCCSGGAALTRNYVENDLAEYQGEVHYARRFRGPEVDGHHASAKRGEAPAAGRKPLGA